MKQILGRLTIGRITGFNQFPIALKPLAHRRRFVANSVGLFQQFICNTHTAGLGTHCNAEAGDEKRRDDHVSIEIVTVLDRIVPLFSEGFDFSWIHLLPVFRVDEMIESLLIPGSAEVQLLLLFFPLESRGRVRDLWNYHHWTHLQ